MEIEELKNELKEKYLKDDEFRYAHSLGVADMAEKLAKHYNIEVEKAVKTGLMHDMAKQMELADMLKYITENNLQVSKEEIDAKVTLHGIVAGDICRKEYEFDEEMCNAISNHTMGRENMSMFEKVIYIADKIDMTRDYEGVQELRELAFLNIDMAIIRSIEKFINKNIKEGKIILTGSIKTRNFILKNQMK